MIVNPVIQTLTVLAFWAVGLSVMTNALVGTLRLLRKGY